MPDFRIAGKPAPLCGKGRRRAWSRQAPSRAATARPRDLTLPRAYPVLGAASRSAPSLPGQSPN